jgi:DNA-binding Lrp family transcriptional regulator
MVSDWSLLRAIAAARSSGASARAIADAQQIAETDAVAALRRLAESGLIRECEARAEPGSAPYRVTARGIAVLLNAVMI